MWFQVTSCLTYQRKGFNLVTTTQILRASPYLSLSSSLLLPPFIPSLFSPLFLSSVLVIFRVESETLSTNSKRRNIENALTQLMKSAVDGGGSMWQNDTHFVFLHNCLSKLEISENNLLFKYPFRITQGCLFHLMKRKTKRNKLSFLYHARALRG